MAKEEDQTQQTDEDKAATAEVKEDTTAVDKAVKTSEAFDKDIDDNPEDVEDTPPEDKDDKSKDSKGSEKKDDSKADEKDTGDKEDTKDSDKGGDKSKAEISDELNQKALDLGLTEEELKDFDSAEALEKIVSDIEKAVAIDEPAKKADSAQTADKDKKKDEDTKGDKSLKFENEDEIDPELLKGMKSLEQTNKEQRERIDKLENNIEQEKQVRLQEVQTQFAKRMDGMVGKLGLEFAGIFGKGPIAKLDRTSSAFKARDSVRAHMRGIAVGLAESGTEIPDEQKLFDMAVRYLHEEKVNTVNGLRSSKKGAKYAKGAKLGRSATKKTGKLTGDQKAIETSKAFDEQIDMTEDDE